MAVFLGSAVVYFAESFLFLWVQWRFPQSVVAFIYPQYETLARYCSSNACLFDPLAVSSLYALQLFTLILLSIVQAFVMMRSKGRPSRVVKGIDRSTVIFVSIIVLAVALDYVGGDFSFSDIHTSFPNRVTESPSGLFFYVFRFWLFGIANLLLVSAMRTCRSDAPA
jgi:hypothetical protein